MERRMTVDDYLAGEETTQPQELAYGILREPPTPTFHHQMVVGRLYRRLDAHVRRRRLGHVVVSPIDVILDRDRALIVQPDVVFVSAARQAICTDRIWGAPDLAVEVLSSSNRRHDRTVKVKWYRDYGVRECWLVDPIACHIEVMALTVPEAGSQVVEDRLIVRSAVLPRVRLRPADVFTA